MKILIITLLLSNLTFSQNNNCDQKLLSREEFEKCANDSVWKNDLKIKTEYITVFKTVLLPKYRILRKRLETTDEINSKILTAKAIYDSVLITKSNHYKNDIDKKGNFVQPNSYLSTALSLEIFKFYPDIYAILLNPIHQQLNPKTSNKDLKKYKKIVDDLINILQDKDYVEITKIVKNLRDEKQKLLNNKKIELFQGAISDDERLKYDVANFLIWKE